MPSYILDVDAKSSHEPESRLGVLEELDLDFQGDPCDAIDNANPRNGPLDVLAFPHSCLLP